MIETAHIAWSPDEDDDELPTVEQPFRLVRLTENVQLWQGDCRDVLAALDPESVDSVVCDPPYGLTFMGKDWDHGVPAEHFWTEALRVLKPGGYLLAFGGTRTFHRLAVAIEDAGFEVRDCLMYLYGSGFPKSMDVRKAAKDACCQCDPVSKHDVRAVLDTDVPTAEGTARGSGSVLLPSVPQQSASTDGTSSSEHPIREYESSVEGRGDLQAQQGQLHGSEVREMSTAPAGDGAQGWLRDGASLGDGSVGWPTADPNGGGASRGSRPIEQLPIEPHAVADERLAQASGGWPLCGRCGLPDVTGWGTALKPAWEPIILARKPFRGTVAANVLEHGTGALNIDATRISTSENLNGGAYAVNGNRSESHSLHGGTGMNVPGKTVGTEFTQPSGRWPANVLLSHTEECVQVGTKTVKPSNGSGRASAKSGGFGGGMFGDGTSDNIGGTSLDADGTETIESWQCVEDCPVRLLDEQSGNRPGFSGGGTRGAGFNTEYVGGVRKDTDLPATYFNDSGGASRFYYTSKVSKRERNAGMPEGSINDHPTAKPITVMRWLVRMVTQPGGVVLDPFMGSGSTGCAAMAEGFRFVGIDLDPHYVDIAAHRIAYAELDA